MKGRSRVMGIVLLVLGLGIHFVLDECIRAEEEKGPKIIFEQHFENINDIRESGAQFLGGQPKVIQFIPGIKGNAIYVPDTTSPYICYENLEKILNPDEGTVEFYVMIDWKEWSIEKGKWAISPIRIMLPEPPNNRIQILIGNFNGRCIYSRVIGDKYLMSIETWKSKTWHHVAVTWKANSGDGKDGYNIYIDRDLIYADSSCNLVYKPEHLVRGVMQLLVPDKAPSWPDVAYVGMAIDELKIWDKQIDFSNVF